MAIADRGIEFTLAASGFRSVDATGRPADYGLFLDAITVMLRDEKQRGFAALGVAPGQSVLDVGCGTGSDACDLAQLVGPHGHVVGVDTSVGLAGEAHRRGQAAQLGIAVQVADAHALPFPAGTFDRVRADRVLQHLESPLAAVMEMTRVLRPGGRLGLTDPDWGTLAIDAPDVRTTRMVTDFFCHSTIRHGWSGRRLPALCHDAGLADVQIEARPLLLRALGPFIVMLGLPTVLESAVASGVVSPAAARQWQRTLETADQGARFVAALMVWQVTATKPAR